MATVPRVNQAKASNSLVGLMNIMPRKTAQAAQKGVLPDSMLTPAQFREIMSGQKLEVTQGIAKSQKGAPLNMDTPTLYLICW